MPKQGGVLRLFSSGLALGMIVRQVARRKHAAPADPAPPLPPQQAPEAALPAAAARPAGMLGSFKATFSHFSEDECPTMAAALSYYTIFSLPPLLLIVIGVVGLVFGRAAVEGQIQQQIQGLIGAGAAGQVSTMVRSAGQNPSAGIVSIVLGGLALLYGASGAFVQLQSALDRVWHVKPDPNAGGVKNFLTQRLLTFGMVLGIAFLLLVSLAVSAALTAFSGALESVLPSAFSGVLLHALNLAVSFGVITVLFAAIFKALPDAAIEWRDVWVGAVITSALFNIGKFLIGFYLAKSGTASAYGAAGSLVLMFLWVYYASMILLLGAEFTRVWAEARGPGIKPKQGAVQVIQEERRAA